MDAWTIYIYLILLLFINAAISEDVMIFNNLLESSIAGVKSTKCIVLGKYPDAALDTRLQLI